MADTTEQQHAEDTHDPQFEPVIKLTEQVEAKTGEEDDEVVYKQSVASFPLTNSELIKDGQSSSDSSKPISNGKREVLEISDF